MAAPPAFRYSLACYRAADADPDGDEPDSELLSDDAAQLMAAAARLWTERKRRYPCLVLIEQFSEAIDDYAVMREWRAT